MYFYRILLISIFAILTAQFTAAQFELPVEFALIDDSDDEDFSDIGSIDSSDEEENARDITRETWEPVPRPQMAPKRERDAEGGGFSDEEDVVRRPAGRELRRNAETVLMIAARNNDVAEINRLAQMPGFNVNAQNEFGGTALHAAAGANAVAAAIRLLELGAERDIQNESGETALSKAQSSELDLIVDILLNYPR